MTIPNADLNIIGRCPRCMSPLRLSGNTWVCPECSVEWDHDGSNGRYQRLQPAPLITDRATDSTSASVLDQPQPD